MENYIDFLKKIELDESSYYGLAKDIKDGKMYHSFFIPKRNDGFRKINSPNNLLKHIQKCILKQLNEKYVNINTCCSYGFEKNKNNIENARKHSHKKYIFNVDLKDFFTQITQNRVDGVLKLIYDDKISKIISTLCCYNNYLPQGAPTSPILSNMVLNKLDKAILYFVSKKGLYYTRYADDITISGDYDFYNIVFKSKLKEAYILNDSFIDIFNKEKFSINNKKIKFFGINQRKIVTGLIVNETPNIQKSKLKMLRFILLHCRDHFSIVKTAKKYYELNKIDISKINEESLYKKFSLCLRGKIQYVINVKSKYNKTCLWLAKQYNKSFGQFFQTSDIRKELDIEKACCVIESNNKQGTGFYLKKYGIITVAHIFDEKDKNNIKGCIVKYNGMEFTFKSEDFIIFDNRLDYVLLNIKKYEYLENNLYPFIHENKECSRGDLVRLIGYPGYVPTDNITDYTARITNDRRKGLKPGNIETIDKNIEEGMSGGPVLNRNNNIVGMISQGCGNVANGFKNFECIFNSLNTKYT